MKAAKMKAALVAAALMASAVTATTAQAAPKISATKATLSVGAKLRLKVTGANGAKVKWSSANPKVATVSSKGWIKGVAPGSTKVTAKVGSKKLSCKVKVKKAPAATKATMAKSMTLTVGQRATAAVKFSPEGAKGPKMKYSSSNPKVASVDSNGGVTAKREGTATITARSTSGKKLTAKTVVTVRRIVKLTISAKGDGAKFAKGAKMTATVKVSPKGYASGFEWRTSNAKVAKVKGDGAKATITAVAPGTATITASATDKYGEKRAVSMDVKVEKEDASISGYEAVCSKKTLPKGYAVKAADFKLYAKRADGTKEPVGFAVTQTLDASTKDGVTTGTYHFTFKVDGKAVTKLDVPMTPTKAAAAASVVSLSVTLGGGKTSLPKDYVLSADDFVVKAKLSDGKERPATGVRISTKLTTTTSGTKTTGTWTITATAEGATSTIYVPMTPYEAKPAATVTSISVKPRLAQFDRGYSFKTSDFEVTAKMSDGTTKAVETFAMSWSAKTQTAADGTVTGSATVTVTYAGKTQTVTIPMKAIPGSGGSSGTGETATVKSISARSLIPEWEEGHVFSADDFEVTAKMSDGTSKIVKSGFSISGKKTTQTQGYVTTGEFVATLSYKGASTTVTIPMKPKTVASEEPEGVVVGLSVTSRVVSYDEGRTFSSDDFLVEATFDTGVTKVVKGFSLKWQASTATAADGTKTGECVATVTYGGKSATVRIPMNPIPGSGSGAGGETPGQGQGQDLGSGQGGQTTATLESLSVTCSLAEADAAAQITRSTLSVTGTYSDGSTKAIDGYSFSAVKDGDWYVVTATYEGKSATTRVAVKKKIAASISVTCSLDEAEDASEITKDTLTVTAYYADGTSAPLESYTASAVCPENGTEFTVTVTATDGSGATATTTVRRKIVETEAPSVVSFDAYCSKDSVAYEDELKLSDFVVTETLSDGTTRACQTYSVEVEYDRTSESFVCVVKHTVIGSTKRIVVPCSNPPQPQTEPETEDPSRTVTQVDWRLSPATVYVGEGLAEGQLTAVATYGDGRTESVAVTHDFTPKDVPGAYEIHMSAAGFNSTRTIEVVAKEVTVKSLSAQTTRGWILDTESPGRSDFSVTAEMSDGTTLADPDYQISYEPGAFHGDDAYATITFGGKEARLPLKWYVSTTPKSMSIEWVPTIGIGEELGPDYVKVTVTNYAGDTYETSDYSHDFTPKQEPGVYAVTLTCGPLTQTFDVTVE